MKKTIIITGIVLSIILMIGIKFAKTNNRVVVLEEQIKRYVKLLWFYKLKTIYRRYYEK